MNLTINGRQVTVDDGFRNLSREEQDATVEEIAGSMPKKEASGNVAGISRGASELINGPAETLKRFAGVGSGRTEDPNYVPADVRNGSWNPLNWNGSQIPQAVAEMAPSVAADAVAGKVGSKVGSVFGAKGKLAGALIGAGLSGWLRSAGDTAKEATAARTGDANAESSTGDLVRGGATAAAANAVGALLPTRFIPGLTKASSTVGAEGAKDALKSYGATAATGFGASGAADAITQVGTTIGTEKGLTVDPERVGNAAVNGMLTAATMKAPQYLADNMRARNLREFGGENKDATENYATRLQTAGDGLGGLGNAARDAAAHGMVKRELTNELGDAAKPFKLSPDADNALQRAKTDQPITPRDLALIESETAGHPDGANASYLARTLRMAQLAQSKGSYSSKGWAGGLSGTLEANLGYMLNPTRIMGGALASAAGMHLLGLSNPMFAGGVAGGYGVARGIDSMTGMRSPAKTFAEHFASQSAQLRMPSTPQAPPAAPAGPATASPWGPRPPMSGPTGPQVAPQAPPQAPQGPWGPKPLATTSVPQMSAPGAPPAAPPAPQPNINPMALMMLKQKLKQGLPPEPEAPKAPPPVVAAPVAPPTTEVGTDVLAKSKRLMAGLKAIQKLKSDTLAPTGAAADLGAAAATRPSPKSIGDILQRLTADVPAPKKITKTKGKVETEAGGPEVTRSPYEPIADEHLYPKDISAKAYAIGEAGKYGARSPTYIAKAEASAQKRINAAAEVTSRYPQYKHAISGLLRQLHVIGANPAEVSRAVDHYANHLPADAAAAVREAFK